MMRLFVTVLAAAALAACTPPADKPAEAPSEPAVAAPAVAPEPEPVGDDAAATPDDMVGIPAGETGGMCGGFAGIVCLNEADFCKYPDGECQSVADGAGVCTVKPEICPEDFVPVCGCDGVTYPNACKAAAAGQSVASEGECPKAG